MMIWLAWAILGCSDAEPDDGKPVCETDIQEYDCGQDNYYQCDKCNDVWACSNDGWLPVSIECRCVTDEGRYDTGACPYEF